MTVLAIGQRIHVSEKHGVCIVQDIRDDVADMVTASGDVVQVVISDIPGIEGDYSADDVLLRIICDECGSVVPYDESPDIGQATVEDCPNCGMSWTVYNPPLERHRTEDFELIWPHIAQ